MPARISDPRPPSTAPPPWYTQWRSKVGSGVDAVREGEGRAGGGRAYLSGGQAGRQQAEHTPAV